MDVPQELLTNFDVGVDAMLRSDMAPTCILVYPPQKTECPNCIVNPISGESSGKYKSGGPRSFEDGQVCPWCQGFGSIDTESNGTIKLLIEWNPKEYRDIISLSQLHPGNVDIFQYPNGAIKVQGYIADLRKFREAIELRVHSALGDYDMWRYKRHGEPIPFGITHNSFFSCILTRVA